MTDFVAQLLSKPPTCAVCKKPVDGMRHWVDHYAERLYITVYCHGETETTDIPEELAEEALGFRMGTAFNPKPLLEPPCR